jgi:hypothetical protein
MVGFPRILLVNTSKTDNRIMATMNQLKILPHHSEKISIFLTKALVASMMEPPLYQIPLPPRLRVVPTLLKGERDY